MKILVFIGNEVDITKYSFNDYYIVAVDKGAKILLDNNISFSYAIGDFDSISNEDLNKIKSISKTRILNPIKNETDTLEALEYAFSLSDDVTLLGGIQGKRIEHFLANICLFKKFPKLKIIDDNSYIELVDTSKTYFIDEYKYISFFSLENSIISLKGFKYNLDNYSLDMFDSLCISNEIVDKACLIVEKGVILAIKSKNDIDN